MVDGWADVEGDELRWTLGRRANDRPLMLIVGHNPSTADARKNDPTVLRWLHFALSWGHGGYIAVNLYPYRTSSPTECRRLAAADKRLETVLKWNLDVIAEQMEKCERNVVAWGNISADDQMMHGVCEMLGTPLWCFGITQHGHPKHVMARGAHRIENSQKPVEWDYLKYRASLQPAA